ncbi:MAG: hypothetical protein IIA87_05615 [Nanoarchaeota archaeon]|nr:hypothetical protein [Nanoarchaeota archaeon]
MCWSFGAAAIFAIIGFGFAGYLAYKKESKLLWIPLGYFALMEALQAVTYFYLGDCASSANRFLTLLSLLHLAFQPLFINALVMYFIPTRIRKRIFWWVMGIAFLATIIMLIKIYPFAWAGSCTPGTSFCGEIMCSIKGNWHLSWIFPLNALGGLSIMTYHIMAAFLLPLIYGSWKTTLYGFILGPVISFLSTSNPNEWPAVWCLISVGIILIIIFPKVREAFRVKKWYFWEYPHK